MVESYRDLVAWQKAMELVVDVYLMTEQLPSVEKYGLKSQLRRAAVSIPSALAEGHARASTKEFARYISIAMGSLAEVETQVELCSRLALAEPATTRRVMDACAEQGRILRGLKKSLDSRISARSRIAP
jgi:four helix bundle protein